MAGPGFASANALCASQRRPVTVSASVPAMVRASCQRRCALPASGIGASIAADSAFDCHSAGSATMARVWPG